MGDKKPSKRYSSLRIQEWQLDSINEIKDELGVESKIDVITFFIRLYSLYREYRERIGAKDLIEFAKILDAFLPKNPYHKVISAFNKFQEELYSAEVPDHVIEEITEFCMSKIEDKVFEGLPAVRRSDRIDKMFPRG